MPDFFKEAELSDIKQGLRPIQSVDLSAVPQRFTQRYGDVERTEEEERKLDLERSFRGAEQQKLGQLGQVAGQIGESALGARGEFLTEPDDISRQFGLTSKEVSKSLEPEIQKRARIQELKNEMASKQIAEFSRRFEKDSQTFNRNIQKYSRELSNRMVDEKEELLKKQNDKYDSAVENLKRKLIRRKTGGLLLSSLGKIAGGIIGGVATGGALPAISAGIGIGGSFSGGFGNLFGSRRRLPINF